MDGVVVGSRGGTAGLYRLTGTGPAAAPSIGGSLGATLGTMANKYCTVMPHEVLPHSIICDIFNLEKGVTHTVLMSQVRAAMVETPSDDFKAFLFS